MFKLIEEKSGSRSVFKIEISFTKDAFGKLNVYAHKGQINYKRQKNKRTYIQDGYH